MSSPSAPLTNCHLRSNERYPTYPVENADQESLVHALSMSLRRTRYSTNDDNEHNPKVSDEPSPFSLLATRHNDTRPRGCTQSAEQRRTEISNILNEALNIMDRFQTDLPLLTVNSQDSSPAIAMNTEFDSAEDSINPRQ
jgi:hypothetical protein